MATELTAAESAVVAGLRSQSWYTTGELRLRLRLLAERHGLDPVTAEVLALRNFDREDGIHWCRERGEG